MLNSRLASLFLELDFNVDLRPHLRELEGGGLGWAGAFDKSNKACIANTQFGTRFAPAQALGLLHEIATRPHLSPLIVCEAFTTAKGNLQKFGGECMARHLTPWERKFGSRPNNVRDGGHLQLIIQSRPLSEARPTTVRRVRSMGKALERLKDSLQGHCATQWAIRL